MGVRYEKDVVKVVDESINIAKVSQKSKRTKKSTLNTIEAVLQEAEPKKSRLRKTSASQKKRVSSVEAPPNTDDGSSVDTSTTDGD